MYSSCNIYWNISCNIHWNISCNMCWHISTNVEGNIDIIVKAMDAFYSNSDNANIPVIEAIRIVSMVQDDKDKKANLYLLKAQRKYAR